MNTPTTERVGQALRSRATHHHHGDGWTYSRGIEGLEHIRYRRDYTGDNHWTRRLARALDIKHLLGIDDFSREFKPKKISLKWRLAMARAHFRVNFRKESNIPDGSINGNFTFWEEDGEYIEMVGPTIGVKIADFLTSEPENPHAIAIAEEIKRIWALSKARREGEQ